MGDKHLVIQANKPLLSLSTRLSHANRVGVLGVLLFFGITLAQLTHTLLSARPQLSMGSVSQRDVRAPQRGVFVSELETNRQRDLASAAVPVVYTPPDGHVARRQLSVAREALDRVLQIRTGDDQDESTRLHQIQNLPNLSLDLNTARILLGVPPLHWPAVDAQVVQTLDESMRDSIRADNLDFAKAHIQNRISLIFTFEEVGAINSMVTGLLVPNTSVNTSATNEARARARNAIKPVERVYEAGQIVVRAGDVLGAADIEALEKLNLQSLDLTWPDLVSVLATSLVSVLALGLAVLYGDGLNHLRIRRAALAGALLIAGVALLRWMLPGRQSGAFLAPLLALSMCISTWMGVLPGVISAVLMGGLAGMGSEKPVEIAAFYSVGMLIATLSLRRFERLGDFVRAAALGLACQLMVLLAFEVPLWLNTRDTGTLALHVIAAIGSGVISGALAPLILYVTGWLSGMTTPLQLIELSRPSHPLQQKLIQLAPGSYHHSLMVANLAEHAAERIGADSLLVRVGAYYHDIGKMQHPYFFVENQLDGKNVHDELDPLTSSRVLHSHVSDGLELADQHRLPAEVRAFIAEHHGTTRTNVAYMRAVKANAEAPLDDALFRYPGPRPSSRETALVMLADAAEAIVRARKPATVDQTDEIVRKLIADRIADHQLDECALSLKDLDLVRVSFIETLRGMYHPRIEYPEAQPVRAHVITSSPALSLPTQSAPMTAQSVTPAQIG